MNKNQIRMILQNIRFQLDEIDNSLENDNVNIIGDINDMIDKLKKIKFLTKQHLQFFVGQKIKIIGEICYMQDFSVHEGSFSKDIIFEIVSIINENRYRLIADGYGQIGGKYGNGSISVLATYQDKFELVK